MGIGDEFRSRRYSVRTSAQELFTNREAEMAVFRAKLEQLRELRRENPDWAADIDSPRRNVLVFYGYGGIGKTSLSKEIERRFTETSAEGTQAVAVRVDFSEPSSRDAELYLLALRTGLTRAARALPAFDTALAVYWARQHPGTSVAEFVQHQSVLGGLTDRATLVDHLKGFTQDLLDNAGPAFSAGRRLAGITWEAIQNTRTVRRLRSDCALFQPCVEEEDLDVLRLYLPALLAWDLAHLKDSRNLDVVVFLDTFERVSHGQRRSRKGDLEDAIAHSAFFLPATAFVVTTRRRLTWGSPARRADLDFHGPALWPGLVEPTDSDVAGETDQHEVGVFSQEDCEHYLSTFVPDRMNQPVIPPPLRRHIGSLSGGVPLYLDVATNHFLSLRASGHTPTRDDFEAGLPEIVMRLMEDLSDDETDLLRVAALLGVFDAATLRAALPDVRSAGVRNFVDHSFVLERGDGLFSIHELLQASVRTQDMHTSNAWSPDEWRAAEERLVSYWSAEFADNSAELWRDRRSQALAFWQLCGLYATTDVDADVLAEVIMMVQMQGVWSTFDAGRDQPDQLVNHRGGGLLTALDGVMERQVGELSETDRLLSEAVDHPALSANLKRLAMYYLAETRDLRSESPTHLFEELAQLDDRIGVEARIALAHAHVRDKDLAAALDIGEDLSAHLEDPEFRYRLHELLGTIHLFAGELEQAEHHFEISRQVGEDEGSPLLLALGLRHLALTLCWNKPEKASTYLDEAEALNHDLGLPPGIGQCLTARAIASIGSAPPDEIYATLADADATFTRAGYLDDAIAPVAAAVLVAATGNQEEALARRDELISRSHGRRVRTWLAAADAWTNRTEHFDEVSWPSGRDRAYDLWRRVLTTRVGPEATNQPTPPRLIWGDALAFDSRTPVEVVDPVELVETAIDLHVSAGHVAAHGRISEEGNHVGHVAGFPQPPGRHHGLTPSTVLRCIRHGVRPRVYCTR